MDGENNGLNPMNKWMIWGYHYFWFNTQMHPFFCSKAQLSWQIGGFGIPGVPPSNKDPRNPPAQNHQITVR